MNPQNKEFIYALIKNLKENEMDLSKPIILTQRMYLNTIRSFFNYSTEKKVIWKAKQLVEDGLFLSNRTDFELSATVKELLIPGDD